MSLTHLVICFLGLSILSNNFVLSQKVGDGKTLVILDDWHLVDTHSLFWSQVRKMGFNLDFRMISDVDIKLTYFGEYTYTNIIYAAPSFNEQSRKNEITIQNLLKFLDDGHDIFLFADKNTGSFLRKLVNEFGVDFDDYESQVKDSLYIHNLRDFLHKDLVSMRNDEIVVTKNIINVPVVASKPDNYILYEGIGMDLDPQSSYAFPILKADENSYSINKKTKEVYSNGDKVKLVAGYQARNNRRVVISGGINLCSDKFYYLSNVNGTSDILASPNGKFCQDMLNWNFQKSGVLKFENIRHRRQSDGVSLPTYRIKDDLEYYIDIYEYDAKSDSWKPYLTDDIQLEYVMMNPYYINQMRLLSNSEPTYYVKFKAPEKFGVFKFIVDYKRVGYSYIFSSTKVPLRPFNHNEYQRFIPCAYPYYLSVFIVLSSFVLFSILFLYGKSDSKTE